MGWKVRESNPGGGCGRFSAPIQTGPEAHPASWTMGTGSFPWGKGGRGVTLTTHLYLVPRSGKSRPRTLLPLWARVACYRVKPYLTLRLLCGEQICSQQTAILSHTYLPLCIVTAGYNQNKLQRAPQSKERSMHSVPYNKLSG